MKHTKSIALLLCAALLSGLFAGCAKTPAESTASPVTESAVISTEDSHAAEPASTAPETFAAGSSESAAELATTAATTAEDDPSEPADEALIRWQNGGLMSFLPKEPVSVPSLAELRYSRPDVDALIAQLEALTEKARQCDDAEALLEDYYALLPAYQNYSTMYSIAYLRFSQDSSDEYFQEEYDYCDEHEADVTEQEHALYAVLAASPCRNALEAAYFGSGFFADYDNYNTADESFYALSVQENNLILRYYDLVGEQSRNNSDFVENNHDALGTVFMELIQVRQQLAAAKGYDNYMDYIYANQYMRDYSTAQAREFLDNVQANLAPLASEYSIQTAYGCSIPYPLTAIDELSSAAERMGGPIWDAFRFMSAYELYDISYGSNKLSTGYTSYLDAYEAPFIFIDPKNYDVAPAIHHEFGHFTDCYCNYGLIPDYETAEFYSQAMEYLAYAYTSAYPQEQTAGNCRAVLSDLLRSNILRQAAYADFELQAYALAPEEITLKRLDEIFLNCMEKYCVAQYYSPSVTSMSWVPVPHFFAYPGYVISYATSAVASLQICRLEAEQPGAGVDAYCRLLNRSRNKHFAAILAGAGLDSPFEAGTLEKTAAFYKKSFDLE